MENSDRHPRRAFAADLVFAVTRIRRKENRYVASLRTSVWRFGCNYGANGCCSNGLLIDTDSVPYRHTGLQRASADVLKTGLHDSDLSSFTARLLDSRDDGPGDTFLHNAARPVLSSRLHDGGTDDFIFLWRWKQCFFDAKCTANTARSSSADVRPDFASGRAAESTANGIDGLEESPSGFFFAWQI